MRGFVSGGADVLLARASQGQIAATHQPLGTCQEMANLCTQIAIGRPTFDHGINPEQCCRNVAMTRTSLPRIKRL